MILLLTKYVSDTELAQVKSDIFNIYDYGQTGISEHNG